VNSLIEPVRAWFADPTFGRLTALVIGGVLVWVAVRIVNRMLGRAIEGSEARYRSRKLVAFGGYLAILIIGLTIYSGQLGGLGVTLGVAGAGIAFALQEAIASVAGWFAISMAHFYRTGDRVQLGGTKGDVIDIGVLRTTLMEVGEWVKGDLYTGRLVRIANSFVFKEPVFNYSADFPFLWDEITVPIKYGSDWQAARALLERVAIEVVGEYTELAKTHWKVVTRSYLVEDARVDPMVTMVANDNWIEFTIRYVVDFKLRRRTKDRLFTRILEEIDRTESRIGIASATFHLVEAPAIRVQLDRTAERTG